MGRHHAGGGAGGGAATWRVGVALAVALALFALAPAPVRAEYVQQAKITTTAGASERLGSSVAVSADGTVAVAGASNNGAPYVFVRTGATWRRQARLACDAVYALGQFGVAISGDGAVIAAAGVPDGSPYTQVVCMFVREGGAWVQRAKLASGDGTDSNFFGAALALSADGGILVAGDRSAGSGGSYPGAAYVFARTGATWARQARLMPGAGDSLSGFGLAVATSADGGIALVGNTAYGNPSAYVFARSGSAWTQQAKLVGPLDPYVSSGFGTAVALTGDGRTAAVSDPYENGSGGVVYVFVRGGAAWERVARLTSGDDTVGGFGRRVAMSGDGGTLVATATRQPDSGTATVFRGSGATWLRTRTLVAGDANNYDHLGTALAVSDGGLVVAVGAQDNDFIGAVYAFFDRLLVRLGIAPAGGAGVGTPTVGIGETLPLAATGAYNDGTVQPEVGVAWATSDASRATVDGAGRATGVAAGPVTITATKGGVTGSFTLVVTAPASAIGPAAPRLASLPVGTVPPAPPSRVGMPGAGVAPTPVPMRR